MKQTIEELEGLAKYSYCFSKQKENEHELTNEEKALHKPCKNL
jgi:hypothetical protein